MYIYKTTNLINNKIYIGLSTKSVEESEDYLGSGTAIQLSIEKYGKENFIKEIIERDIKSRDLLNEREIYWIKTLKSTEKTIGYNILPGGGLLPKEHQIRAASKAGKSSYKNRAINGQFDSFSKKGTEHSRISNTGNFECPHCGKESTWKLSINRYHFDNCKNNKNRVVNPKYVSECPHCGKTGRNSNMKRYHFDNCKHKR